MTHSLKYYSYFKFATLIYNIEIDSLMGETCSTPEMDTEPQPQVRKIRERIPFEPLEEMDSNKQSTQSHLIQDRTDFVKRCN